MHRLLIRDIAYGGAGVARLEGKAVFVPFTIDGETVHARLVRDRGRYAEAELVEVLELSPQRVTPACPYFGKCGGCVYQHIAYEHQLAIKTRQVEQALRRLGGIETPPMGKAVASPLVYGFRNRIRVHARDGKIGFHMARSREIIDIEQCLLGSVEVNEALRRLRTRRAKLRDGDYNLAAGKPPEFFEQTNEGAARLLGDLAAGLVRRNQSLLVDAYCGAGFFAKRLAGLFPKIVGIEQNPAAVQRARQGATARESYLAGDVNTQLGPVLEDADPATTTVLLDPPAAGLNPRVIELLRAFHPSEILYVSCDPATLARDVAGLRGAYQLASVTPLDMFPQTAAIEVVAHLI